jgi:hypothetical protein
MDDPFVNVIVFELKSAGAPTRYVKEGVATAQDSIRQAWFAAKEEHALQESDILRVYTDWEPSPEDSHFMTNAFPDSTTLTFSFERPLGGAREEAFRRARDVISKSAALKQQSVPPPGTDPEFDRLSFYPVLRHVSDQSDIVYQTVLNFPIASDLGVFLCRRITTPNGTIGIEYVMNSRVSDFQFSVDDIFDLAYENFFNTGSITCDERQWEDDRMIHLHNSQGFVTTLLGDQKSYQDFSAIVGSHDIAVAILSRDDLLITAMGSVFERDLSRMIKEHGAEDSGIDLEPSVYHWTTIDKGFAGLSRIA